jgi:hypothetical protein
MKNRRFIQIWFLALILFGAPFSELLSAAELTNKVSLSGELATREWMPTKNGFPNVTYSPLCKGDTNYSQKRVKLLKDTNFLFRNLKAGDVLFGVASIYQAKTYTIRAVAYCKPEFDSSNGRNHKTCLYDFNNDGIFDDRSDNPARISKVPSEDFTKTKHQYPYELIDFEGEKESITTCVTENDTTWTADYKPKDAEKKAKALDAAGNLMSRYESAKQNSSVVCTGEKICKKYFQLTQLFINNNSDMKIQVATDTIVETYNPTDLYKIGMKASKYPGKDDSEKIIIDVICKSEANDALCIQKETAIYEKFRLFIDMSLQ